MGVRRSRLFQVLARLRELGLVHDVPVDGNRRLALANRGLTLLARRDRSSVGAARKRWSVVPIDAQEPLNWRNVSGRRCRQLLRNLEHTESVHWFAAALERQSHTRPIRLAQLDPPHRASRYFRFNEGLRSIHPDAFLVLKRSEHNKPFFLEWERRAVRPVTMAARLAPYLRYYSSHRPMDDHGVQPTLLVVFDDELAAIHFLRVAKGGDDPRRSDRPPAGFAQEVSGAAGTPGQSPGALRQDRNQFSPSQAGRRLSVPVLCFHNRHELG